MYIAKNLKFIRETKEVSRTRMAKDIGIKESVIRNIETGKTKNPTIGTLNKICDYFKISLNCLVNNNLAEPLELPLFGKVAQKRLPFNPYEEIEDLVKCLDFKNMVIIGPENDDDALIQLPKNETKKYKG